MTRPQTVQDVFAVLAQDRLVEPGRLRAFADRNNPVDVPAVLKLLVIDGLLTVYQADEVAGGRGADLWLGGYRVLGRLGKGGMGNVFLAEHAVLGRRVAVKTLSDALRADPGARKRFVREARAAAALDHPNVVRVFDVDMSHEPPYLVMEYVDGVSLQAAVAQTGTFSAGEAATVGVQVANGLAQAAAVGLVHRDIKPANLLIDRRGAAKILDLGIVRFTQDDTHSRPNGADVILGTLDYLAPEQAENSSTVDARADIYSLGATLYFLLAGHAPFPGLNLQQKLAAKQIEDPPPLNRLRPDVPPEFAAVVGRMMSRDPAERSLLVAAALQPWASSGPDFPARLFRSVGSTAHDRRATDHQPPRELLPDTLCITKPARRSTGPADRPPPGGEDGEPRTDVAPAGGFGDPPDPVPSPTEELRIDHAETQSAAGGGALTDEIRFAPPPPAKVPDTFALPVALTPAPAGFPRRVVARLILAALAVVAVALVALAAR